MGIETATQKAQLELRKMYLFECFDPVDAHLDYGVILKVIVGPPHSRQLKGVVETSKVVAL